ncbi:hypothetical protein RSAG8_04565, partial [Rhizoctonia solani AG-8 WAC10335]
MSDASRACPLTTMLGGLLVEAPSRAVGRSGQGAFTRS